MLPRMCQGFEPLTGKIKQELKDYKIEEQLLRPPDGSGKYLWALVRHGQMSTKQVSAALARSVQIDPSLIRFASARDRQAEVHQWFSMPADQVDHPSALKNAGYKKLLRVIQVETHRQAVDDSAIKGLRYTLRLRGAAVDGGYLRAKAILDKLRQKGCPNYIGFARMGPKGQYAKWGKLLFQGKRLPARVNSSQRERHAYLFAYQAQICNRYIAHRMNQDLFDSCLLGDYLQCQLAKPAHQRECILVDDVAAANKRLASWEAVCCAPLIGQEMPALEHEAAAFEAAFLDQLSIADMNKARIAGGRRALRFQPSALRCDDQKQDLILSCVLDSDVYVSALLEELFQPERHII